MGVVAFKSQRNATQRTSTGDYMTVAGHFSGIEAAKAAMGIDWMNRSELAQAIPPVYTQFIGERLLSVMEEKST